MKPDGTNGHLLVLPLRVTLEPCKWNYHFDKRDGMSHT